VATKGQRDDAPWVAIVDYGMGNLYSVRRACEQVGLRSVISGSPDEVISADGVILPGVGAMPDAMRALNQSGMRDALISFSRSGRPLFAVCLGLQLLMSQGSEFGRHEGLGIVPGVVVRFEQPSEGGRRLKVPQVGWNAVWKHAGCNGEEQLHRRWDETPLAGIENGAYMYFVHSYYILPDDPTVSIATTRYGDAEFCSVLGHGSVFGCQFHPERSGPAGLTLYRNFHRVVSDQRQAR
jgi:imidazole glycerol-phosphate synthase subunit HisH